MSSKTYCCRNCGREIFSEDQVIEKVMLWDLREYQAECYRLKSLIDLEGLRRYDCSLHEGWYCCRFIAMRMTEDKFGTGRDLVVYTDSVEETSTHIPNRDIEQKKGQVRIGRRDFTSVLESKKDRLSVVKFGAIWCPPCRLMDQVITRIDQQKTLPEVDFFEVDIDEEQELAERFRIASVPTFFFLYKGSPAIIPGNQNTASFSGGLGQEEFEDLCRRVLENARATG